MNRFAIIDGVRTPFAKMGTVFKGMSAQALGCLVAREVVERCSIDPEQIDEVIFGNVSQPPEAANIARVIALLSGLPKTIPAYTVHRNCASGMEAVAQAALKVQAGEGECFLVGGTESMSRVPFFVSDTLQDLIVAFTRARTWQQKIQALRHFHIADLKPRVGLQLGLTDPVCGLNMGQTAEVLAREFGIPRSEQDQFALESHRKAIEAREILREEIMPVIPAPGYREAVIDDNGPREGQTLEALARLKPCFDRHAGTVTAGNASQITDGAVALLVTSEHLARRLGMEPLGFVRAFAYAGVDPHRMGIGPAHAIPRVLKKAGVRMRSIEAIEINEAFAVQVLACCRLLEDRAFLSRYQYEKWAGPVDPAILNMHGGAIALGHPVGSTGARLILTLLRQMKRRGLTLGLASLCIGGGQGAAFLLERT